MKHWVMATVEDKRFVQIFCLEEVLSDGSLLLAEELGLDEPWRVVKTFKDDITKELNALNSLDEAFGGCFIIDLINVILADAASFLRI